MKQLPRISALILLAVSFSLPLYGCGGSTNSIDTSIYSATTAEEVAEKEKNMIDTQLAIEDPSGPRFYQMIKELGGFDTFSSLMATKDHDHIRSVLSKYGIRYSTEEPGADKPTKNTAEEKTRQLQSINDGTVKPLLVTDCVRFFPAADRSTAYNFGPHIVFIDVFGRPGFSEWRGSPVTPVTPGVRTACGTTVGTWGLPGDDGGHLTPIAVGGSSKRQT